MDFHIELAAPVRRRPSPRARIEAALDSPLLPGALRDLGWLNIAGFTQEERLRLALMAHLIPPCGSQHFEGRGENGL